MGSGWTYRQDRDYDTFFSSQKKEAVRKEVATVVGKVESVLDCGGGLGHLGKHLDCKKYTVLDSCREFDPDILADLGDIPLEDNSYEVCVTKNVLQHVQAWRDALSEIVRVARNRLVLAERTIFDSTKIIERKPVFRRQFNRDEFRGECEKYGKALFRLADADSRIGIYEVSKR